MLDKKVLKTKTEDTVTQTLFMKKELKVDDEKQAEISVQKKPRAPESDTKAGIWQKVLPEIIIEECLPQEDPPKDIPTAAENQVDQIASESDSES